MSMPTITPPSRLERWLRGGGYIFVGTVGVWVTLHPPETLGQALGERWLVYGWCLFMFTGIPAGIMAIMGRFRGEYIMLPFFMGAVAIADVNLFYRAITGPDPDIMQRALIIGALVLAYLARYVTLRRLVRIGIALERRGKFWGRF
jgi:hypothetical protein